MLAAVTTTATSRVTFLRSSTTSRRLCDNLGLTKHSFRRHLVTTPPRTGQSLQRFCNTTITPPSSRHHLHRSIAVVTPPRFSSSLSSEDDIDDMEQPPPQQKGSVAYLPGEEWKVNLRGGEDDSWLIGPRSDDWYTGVHPRDCPGVDENGTLRSLPLPDLRHVTRRSTQDYFDNTWTLYEMLFAGLQGERPFYQPPVHGLRHPQIFYYGHTACLYINKLLLSNLISTPLNPHYESLFEVGVDEMLWDDMHKNDSLWPTVSQVHTYRRQVYDTVSRVIQETLDEEGRSVSMNDDPLWALFMSFEHDRIHLETSSVLFRETAQPFVETPKHWPPVHPSSSQKSRDPIAGVDYPSMNPLIDVPSQSVKIGKPANFPSFGWDNEYGERSVEVPSFKASRYMITNGEFYEFVKEGGYRNETYWSEEGWKWRCFRNMKWPFFWKAAGPEGSHEYKLRTIFQTIPMPWSWPVDVNYYESQAYCHWKSQRDNATTRYRLITEAEHHCLRHNSSFDTDNARETPESDPVLRGITDANLNLRYSSSSPVDNYPSSPSGHNDVFGNAWEWTEDHFNPLEGFEIHDLYDDFSTPCFDGRHSMIMGGSFMSTGDEASVFARFHFRPHFLQHSGFRLVTSNDAIPATKLSSSSNDTPTISTTTSTTSPAMSSNVYTTKALSDMYLNLHFPSSSSEPFLSHKNAPVHGLRFPQRVAELLLQLQPAEGGRYLDVGCAVGGTSFRLASEERVREVVGFDFSDTFIQIAKQMQNPNNQHPITFDIPLEANLSHSVTATHEPETDKSAAQDKITFLTGDACDIPSLQNTHIDAQGQFDGIVAANLLCRLPSPHDFLNALPEITRPGGVVLFVSPYSWLEDFTPCENWLGGFKDTNGKEVWSGDELERVMTSGGFEKIHVEQMPLVIKEHQRKYQYIVSEATGWRKTTL